MQSRLQLDSAVEETITKRNAYFEKQCAGYVKREVTQPEYVVQCPGDADQSQSEKVDIDQGQSDEEHLILLFTKSKSTEPITITVKANQTDLIMEVDTGASVSLLSQATYKQTWQGHLPYLDKTNVRLHTYSGEFLRVLRSITVDVVYENQNNNYP